MERSGVRIRGVPAAPGIAFGRWVVVRRREAPAGGHIAAGGEAAEIARLREAVTRAADDLAALAARVRAEGHEAEAVIFTAHAALARDPMLVDAAIARITDRGEDGATAIRGACAQAVDHLASLDDELLSARAGDVADVADRIARLLDGRSSEEPLLRTRAVVVAEDLPPSLVATLPRDQVLGMVLEGASPTAHAAILARAYGIPAVVGARGMLAALASADSEAGIALDGATGEVVIDPGPGERAELEGRAGRWVETRSRDAADAALPAVTRDGVHVTLLANLGSPADAAPARALGARGVGLFRTEFLFLERAAPPTEDEQTAAYREVVEVFDGDPVTIRLLDAGGDKALPFLSMPHEDNPALGTRALRLAAHRPALFVTQLRACCRAAVAGPVRAMAPMVADAADVALFLRLAARARDGLDAEGVANGPIDLGVMLEIPSAILAADSWTGSVAFASLGTNDLTQYTLAVDRGNPELERYRDAMHPAVLRLVAMAVSSADRAGIPLSVCGESAGDPVAALALVGLGIRQLSMGAASLPAVRRAIRSADSAELAAMARDALGDSSAAMARARFAELGGVA